MLPQLQYGREVDEVTWFTMNAVMFITRIPHLPGYWDFGLPIAHIYDGARFFELDSLVGAADLIDFGARNKITHRLEVCHVAVLDDCGVDSFSQILVAGPNPRITFERQVSACRFTRNPEPLTLSTAARHIARTIWVCIQSYGGQWTLQDGTVVRYEDLVLLELVQISEGSHQIVLAYLQPRICIPTPVAESHQRTWGAGTVSLQGGCSFVCGVFTFFTVPSPDSRATL